MDEMTGSGAYLEEDEVVEDAGLFDHDEALAVKGNADRMSAHMTELTPGTQNILHALGCGTARACYHRDVRYSAVHVQGVHTECGRRCRGKWVHLMEQE